MAFVQEEKAEALIKAEICQDKSKIHSFALRFKNPFESPKTSREFGKLRAELGFEMDCCKAFDLAYPGASSASKELKAALEAGAVKSVKVLASGIYSQWRYWTHWAGTKIDEDGILWFKIAMERLAELTEE